MLPLSVKGWRWRKHRERNQGKYTTSGCAKEEEGMSERRPHAPRHAHAYPQYTTPPPSPPCAARARGDGRWRLRGDGFGASARFAAAGCALDTHSLAPASPHPRPQHTHPPCLHSNLTGGQMRRWSNLTGHGMRHTSRCGSRRVHCSRRRTLCSVCTDRRTGALRLGTRRRVRDVPP